MADRTLTIYRPGTSFPAVSVTGRGCDLQCDHCRGANLKWMSPVLDSDDLVRKASEVKGKGGTGMLISGGCDRSGRVPLAPFMDGIGKAAGMGLELNVHAGLVGAEEAAALTAAGVSVFSVDVHQDPHVIRDVIHLDRGTEAYGETMDAIAAAGGKAVPHVTAGFGTADLLLSVEFLKKRGVREVTLLALVPAEGTEIHAPVPADAVVGAASMLIGEGFDVTLGCMRSRDHEMEVGCIKAGVRKIANPSPRTVRWARDNGFSVVEEKKCCSL